MRNPLRFAIAPRRLGPLFGLLLALGLALAARADDFLLRGGLLYDGTGKEAQPGDVAIRAGRIAAVGRCTPLPTDRVIDCTGLVIAPGFIDMHTHSDGSIGARGARLCLNYLRQGCTTMVTGNCGGGTIEVGRFLASVDRDPPGCNIIHLAPHGTLRSAVLGSARRAPTAEELQKMEALLERALNEGAWGMSTGLIYPPSSYAQTDELTALSRIVARHGGLYASHIRNEGDKLLEAVSEALEIGRQSGAAVEISHFKASGKSNWGRVRPAAELIEQARRTGQVVHADQYPYPASSTSLAATILPDDRVPGGRVKLQERMAADPELQKQVRELIASRMKNSAKIVLAQCKKYPQHAGKTLQQIAEAEGKEPADVALMLVAAGAQVVNHGMSEDDVRWVLTLPWVAAGSDGSAAEIRPGVCPHPRSFGTFARRIGRFAIEEKLISLSFAVRSASGLPADILGLRDRGYLRDGYVADVVVLDPATYRDTATFERPQQMAEGVRWVFVAGQAAIADGQPAAKGYGRALRHPPKN